MKRGDRPVWQMATFERLSDTELIAMAQDGNGQAYECLLERYKNLVRAKARTYFLAGGNTEDLIQEGMIGLYKAIRDYSAGENGRKAPFGMFADMCVTRQILTAVKAATRLKHMPLNSYISFNQPVFEGENEKTLEEILPADGDQDPEEIVMRQESYEIMTARIKEVLSKLEMKVLEHYLSGRSYQEIADDLGKPVKSIDNALQRIKTKLTKEFEG